MFPHWSLSISTFPTITLLSLSSSLFLWVFVSPSASLHTPISLGHFVFYLHFCLIAILSHCYPLCLTTTSWPFIYLSQPPDICSLPPNMICSFGLESPSPISTLWSSLGQLTCSPCYLKFISQPHFSLVSFLHPIWSLPSSLVYELLFLSVCCCQSSPLSIYICSSYLIKNRTVLPPSLSWWFPLISQSLSSITKASFQFPHCCYHSKDWDLCCLCLCCCYCLPQVIPHVLIV